MAILQVGHSNIGSTKHPMLLLSQYTIDSARLASSLTPHSPTEPWATKMLGSEIRSKHYVGFRNTSADLEAIPVASLSVVKVLVQPLFFIILYIRETRIYSTRLSFKVFLGHLCPLQVNKRFVCRSSSPCSLVDVKYYWQALFEAFVEELGCGTGTTYDQLACLRTSSAAALARAQDATL